MGPARFGWMFVLGAGACAFVVLAGCTSGDSAHEGSRTETRTEALSFSAGNNDGYCASNPSAACFHGTPVGSKQIVLTFDDGPASRTLELSSYLKAHGIGATFFVNGKNFDENAASLLSQLVADGHLIGNHTQNHFDLTSLDDGTMLDELTKTDAIISPFVSTGHFVFRAPFGSWSAHDYDVLSASAMNKYVGPVNWDIGGQTTPSYAADWDCWENEGWTTKQCGDRYLQEIADRDRGIVLMHDADYGDSSNHSLTSGIGNSIDMAKYLVDRLEAQGYTFVRLDAVPDIAAALPGGGGGGGVGGCYAPSFEQTTDANEWWVEYGISDATVNAAFLEVVGVRNVPLAFMWGVWVGPTGARVPTGAQVIVHATNAAGQTAVTRPFGFLTVAIPQTEPCN